LKFQTPIRKLLSREGDGNREEGGRREEEEEEEKDGESLARAREREREREREKEREPYTFAACHF